MEKQPLILDIKGNVLDDGPGIRSVVFFKGCPLNCVWCQNPESKKATAELSWDREKCIACGTCISSCPEEAVSKGNPFYVDRKRCTLCFECLELCPSKALTRMGNSYTVSEIIRQIVRFKPFFETSGGGATLSGGEPTQSMHFASDLLKDLKSEGIHTILETCGLFNFGDFSRLIMPYVDAIYMDVKLIDPKEHRRFCGVSNELILNNLVKLHEASRSEPFQLLPRTPLIPGITDGKTQIEALASFYAEHAIGSAVLLPNNPIWLEKCAKLGIETPFDAEDPVRDFYGQGARTRVVGQFSQHGITVTFG